MNRHVWFCMLLLFSFVSSSLQQAYMSQEEKGCTYVIKVQTSDRKRAGTSANVRMTLCSWRNKCFLDIANLAQYGDRGPNYKNYFDKAAFSHFTITTTEWCEPTCLILVAHDGTGRSPQWGVDYIQVEALNPAGAQKFLEKFPIYGSIDTGDTVTIDKCPVSFGDAKYQDVEDHGVTRIFRSQKNSFA